MANPTQTAPEWIELPNGWHFKRDGNTYLMHQPDGTRTGLGCTLRFVQAFAAAMQPQAQPVAPDALREALEAVHDLAQDKETMHTQEGRDNVCSIIVNVLYPSKKAIAQPVAPDALREACLYALRIASKYKTSMQQGNVENDFALIYAELEQALATPAQQAPDHIGGVNKMVSPSTVDASWKHGDGNKTFHHTSPAQPVAAPSQDALVEALEEVVGCFNAAYTEGLIERMAEQENTDAGSLHDLVSRRIMYALTAAQSALAAYSTREV